MSTYQEKFIYQMYFFRRFHEYDLVESPHVRIYGAGPISYVTVTPRDSSLYGFYKCIATNALGEADHTIQLREAFPPALVAQVSFTSQLGFRLFSYQRIFHLLCIILNFVHQVRQETITATSVSFNIVGPAEDMGPPILAFTVQYKENGNYDWNFASNRTWSVNSPYIVENLRPMYTYDFRFAAVNQVGAGSWGSPMTITMPRRYLTPFCYFV